MGKGHYLLGIDVGTSSTKALLASPEGETVAMEQQSYDPDIIPGAVRSRTRRSGGMPWCPC